MSNQYFKLAAGKIITDTKTSCQYVVYGSGFLSRVALAAINSESQQELTAA